MKGKNENKRKKILKDKNWDEMEIKKNYIIIIKSIKMLIFIYFAYKYYYYYYYYYSFFFFPL